MTDLDYQERWEAERAAGRFTVPKCDSCGETFWHPRRYCPYCGSSAISFEEPSWPASIYTFTVNHRPQKGDQEAQASVVGYVELGDGLRVLASLDVDPATIAIGAQVRPEVRQGANGAEFVFVAASGA